MVQPPKIRHSKPQREPVTINLEADAVRREEAADAERAGEPVTGDAVGAPSDVPPQIDEAEADTPAASLEDEQPDTSDESVSPHADRPDEPASPEADRSSGGTARGLVAGLAGGVLVLLVGAGLQYAGIWPAASTGEASGELRQEIAGLRQQVEALSAERPDAAAQTLRGEMDAVTQRVQAAEEALAGLRQSIADGGAGEAPAVAALQGRLQEIEQRIAALGGDAADPAAVSALGDRVGRVEGELGSLMQSLSAAQAASAENGRRLGEFEQRLAALAQSLQEDASDQRLARIVAATALKAAIDRGGPFRAELDAFAAVASDASTASALEPYAQNGVPTRAALISAVPAAASAMVAAANPVPADAGIVDRLAASARSLVSVRPIGPVEGSDAPATVARMEAAVNVGDYAKAIEEYESLPEPVRQAGAAFADDLKARLAAERVVEGALTAAVQSQ